MFDAIGQQMGQKGLAILASRKQHIQNSINKKGQKNMLQKETAITKNNIP